MATLDTIFACTLVGACASAHVDALVARLSGLCEAHTAALERGHHRREALYTHSPPGTPARTHEVRVVQRYTDGEESEWSLLHYGPSVARSDLAAHCRAVLEVRVSASVDAFLVASGHTYVFYSSALLLTRQAPIRVRDVGATLPCAHT